MWPDMQYRMGAEVPFAWEQKRFLPGRKRSFGGVEDALNGGLGRKRTSDEVLNKPSHERITGG